MQSMKDGKLDERVYHNRVKKSKEPVTLLTLSKL